MSIIGRRTEQEYLKALLESDKAEFIMVYGRRRVGKTFLIRQFFQDKFCFRVTGLANSSNEDQLVNFHSALANETGKTDGAVPKNWFEAFDRLKSYLANLDKEKKIIFFDELPWMDGKGSKFIPALEHFWNDFASFDKKVKLIVCGSAASWMVKKIVENHGGLHNRITFKMKLDPFDITEVKEFLHSKHIFWDNQTIAECYMAMGGIPYYLNFLTPEKSLAQNLDAMFFNESSLLEGEFDNLYASLFLHSKEYTDIIEVLSKRKLGYSRDEIINALGCKDGGSLTRKLTELEQCGFIRKYKACNRVNTLYQLIDFFSIFYFQFLRHGSDYDNDIWMHLSRTNTYTTWKGLGFERLCIAHSQKIKAILGINGVSTKTYSVFHPSSQIDMVIERGDNVVNLFEMKFTAEPYSLEKKSAENIANKISVLREQLRKRQSIMTVLVTNQPAKRNEYFTQYIQKNIFLDEIVE